MDLDVVAQLRVELVLNDPRLHPRVFVEVFDVLQAVEVAATYIFVQSLIISSWGTLARGR